MALVSELKFNISIIGMRYAANNTHLTRPEAAYVQIIYTTY